MPALKTLTIEKTGKKVTFRDLTEMSPYNLTRQTIWERWREMRRPEVLTEGMLKRLLAQRLAAVYKSGTVKKVTFDGEEMTHAEMANLLEVTKKTIRLLVAKYGDTIISDQIHINRRITGRKPAPKVLENIEAVPKEEDRSPGWAERKYFPDTGKNGFTGVGKSSEVLPARLVF